MLVSAVRNRLRLSTAGHGACILSRLDDMACHAAGDGLAGALWATLAADRQHPCARGEGVPSTLPSQITLRVVLEPPMLPLFRQLSIKTPTPITLLWVQVMHAWLRLSGFKRLPMEVEEGLAQLMVRHAVASRSFSGQ